MNLPRQHLIPVIHQLKITTIVLTQNIEVVAEALAPSKVLFKNTETTTYRVSSSIYKYSLWQDLRNQSKVQEIVWHLVYKIGSIAMVILSLIQITPP